MKFPPLLLALLATGGTVFGLMALPTHWLTVHVTPPPGKYSGVLTVRRTLIQEGLETTYHVKVDARIAADGQVTILTSTPESPGAAANIENSVVRAAPRPLDTTNQIPTYHTSSSAEPAPGHTIQPPTTTLHFDSTNYRVNGSIPANLSVRSRMVYLNYTVTQSQDPPVAAPGYTTQEPKIPAEVGSISSPASLSESQSTSTGSQNTSAASQGSTIVQGPVTFLPGRLQIPVSRVSYEFALRFQRPLPQPTTAAAPR